MIISSKIRANIDGLTKTIRQSANRVYCVPLGKADEVKLKLKHHQLFFIKYLGVIIYLQDIFSPVFYRAIIKKDAWKNCETSKL